MVIEVCYGCQHLQAHHQSITVTYLDPKCQWIGCGCPWFVPAPAPAPTPAVEEPIVVSPAVAGRAGRVVKVALPPIIIETSAGAHSVTCFECGFLGKSASLQIALNVQSAHLRIHAQEQGRSYVSDGE